MNTLDTTTRKFQAVLAAPVTTNQLTITGSYADINDTAQTLSNNIAPILTNNTTAVDFLPAPGASTHRILETASIYNGDTASATVTVQFNDNGTVYPIGTFALPVGQSLLFTREKGWFVGSSPFEISGTVTANAGTNLNTSLLALESGGNLAGSKADLDILAGCVSAGKLAVTANAGTNLNTSLLALESGGNLAASKADLDILAGCVTASKVAVSGSLTASPADPSATTGSITAQDSASTNAVNSINQSYYTGTPTANSAVSASFTGATGVLVQLSGTFSGTLSFERSVDGSHWFLTRLEQVEVDLTQSAVAISDNKTYLYRGNIGEATNLRVRCTAYSGGTLAVTIQSGYGPGQVVARQGPASAATWPINLTEIGNSAVNTSVGALGVLGVAGVAASGANFSTAAYPIIVGGSDYGGTAKVQIPKVDSSGNAYAVITFASGQPVTQSGPWTVATNADGTTGSAVPSKGLLVQGSDGTDARNLLTTTSGVLKVDLSATAANSTAVKVDGSAVTQPVSWSSQTVTVTQGTAANLQTLANTNADTPIAGTSAPSKGLLVLGKTNDGTPVYDPLPLGTTGRSVIVEGVASGTAVPVSWSSQTVTVTQATGTNLHTVVDSGTLAATQSGTWNIGTVTTVTAVTSITNAVGTNADTTIGGTSAPGKGLLAIGTTNDGTPQYQPIPEGAGGRSVIVEGVASGTAVPVSGTFWQTTQPVSLANHQSVNIDQWNGVTPTAAAALADSTSNPTSPLVGACEEMWDTSHWQRKQCNYQPASVSFTNSTTTQNLVITGTNHNLKGMRLSVAVSASSSGSINPSIDMVDAAGHPVTLWTSSVSITSTGNNTYEFWPGHQTTGTVGTAVKERVSLIVPYIWRINIVANNSNAMSYTVAVELYY